VLPRGTLLNFGTVLGGGLLGWLLGARLNEGLQTIALSGLGLVTIVLGLKMALASEKILAVAAATAFGGMIGYGLGIHAGFAQLAANLQQQLGLQDSKSFVNVVISTSVLYCVGPMTLLGCIQDRIEGKSDLLNLKSTMDGIVAIFFGATNGPAMVVTAFVVLVVQSAIFYGAYPLKRVADDKPLLTETTATGGLMLIGTGLGLLAIKDLTVASYLPALVLAPLLVKLGQRYSRS
jgi:uncharacterized protein